MSTPVCIVAACASGTSGEASFVAPGATDDEDDEHAVTAKSGNAIASVVARDETEAKEEERFMRHLRA
jgi:hypothetical protein